MAERRVGFVSFGLSWAALNPFAKSPCLLVGENFRRHRLVLALQDAITKNKERHRLAFLQSEPGILLLRHARPNREAGAQLQFHSDHDSQKKSVADAGPIGKLVRVGGNPHGEWAKTDPHLFAIGPPRRGELQLPGAPDPFPNLQLEDVENADEPGDKLIHRLL